MYIDMFNGWYFFWLAVCIGATIGIYYLLRNRSLTTKKAVLFGLLALGLLLDILKPNIPPYSVDEARMLRDSWLINICTANIAVFPFIFLSKSQRAKDYMVYIGIISGLIALVYPQEPMAKVDQSAEQLDIIRFYFHHWEVAAVPLLMVVLGVHKISYKRVFSAPTGLLLLMLLIIVNQVLQSELGFVPLRNREEFFEIGYKNTSYIWGPGENDAIGNFFALFTPEVLRTIPVGEYAGQTKYWPWFWLIIPVYLLVTPMAFIIAMIFDRAAFKADAKAFLARFRKTKTPA